MGAYDEVQGILEPYGNQFRVWECTGRVLKQHDLVPQVGMAETYAVVLPAPEDAPVRFLWVQENRITNVMAHQPIMNASVFDKWGKYLGRGGEPLETPGPNPVEKALSLVDMTKMREPEGAPMNEPPPEEVPDVEDFDDVSTKVVPPDALTHRFWLREDFQVFVDLPVDITDEEAERLAVFVTTLPMAAKTSE